MPTPKCKNCYHWQKNRDDPEPNHGCCLADRPDVEVLQKMESDDFMELPCTASDPYYWGKDGEYGAVSVIPRTHRSFVCDRYLPEVQPSCEECYHWERHSAESDFGLCKFGNPELLSGPAQSEQKEHCFSPQEDVVSYPLAGRFVTASWPHTKFDFYCDNWLRKKD